MFFPTFALVFIVLPCIFALETPRPRYTPCGSRGMEPCARGLKCIDNPYRPASRSCGMSCDVPGICVPQSGAAPAPGSGNSTAPATGSGGNSTAPAPGSGNSTAPTPTPRPGSDKGSDAGSSCGGFAGSECRKGLKCVHDTVENRYCSDCVGVCV